MTGPSESPLPRDMRGPGPVIRGSRLGAGTAAAMLAVLATSASLLWPPRPLLLWNASASSPVGLYSVDWRSSLSVGDMVVAWPPPDARRLAAARHYLPASVPLVKRIAAASGARICARGARIYIDGRMAALRRSHDPEGRRLPWWSGCRLLKGGDLLLLSPHSPAAFDGRYFGPTREREVIGRARLLWAD
jgi:conjugative transfer signal peptidase TraF